MNMGLNANNMNTFSGIDIEQMNCMIAEFMGMERTEKTTGEPTFKQDKNAVIWASQLMYRNSWDWLMPVVDKIIEIDITPAPKWTGYRIEIVPRGYVKISGFPMPVIITNVSIEGSLINATWLAVVKFIQWHNLQSVVIGTSVKHSEQEYTGYIKSDLGNGYCMVDLDKHDLKLLYPFGIKAKVDKLIYYIR